MSSFYLGALLIVLLRNPMFCDFSGGGGGLDPRMLLLRNKTMIFFK